MACPACGFAVAPAAKFCAECGQRLDTAAPAVQAAETFPAPQAYTPRYLAEKILTSRRALEGERKQVTVLFADIKGSTELIEGLDPEEARRLLDPALHVMMDAVHRFEGTVNQVLVGVPGAYRVVRDLPTIQVPATVQTVLAARTDRLPPGGQTSAPDCGGHWP